MLTCAPADCSAFTNDCSPSRKGAVQSSIDVLVMKRATHCAPLSSRPGTLAMAGVVSAVGVSKARVVAIVENLQCGYQWGIRTDRGGEAIAIGDYVRIAEALGAGWDE